MGYAKVLGLSEKAGATPLALKEAVARGIDFGRIKLAAHFLGEDEAVFAIGLLGRSTFYRLREKKDARLNPGQSATLARLVRLRELANETFRSAEKADRFMKSPHPALNGETPFKAAMSEFGAEAVTELLGRALYSSAA